MIPHQELECAIPMMLKGFRAFNVEYWIRKSASKTGA